MKPPKIKKIAQLKGHNAAIYALCQGPDPHSFLSAAGDGWVVYWDLRNPDLGKLIAKIDTQIFSLQYLEESHQVVIGNMNGGVHWVPLADKDKTLNIAHHEKGTFDILQVDQHLFTVGGGGKLTRWSIPERRSLESLYLSNQSLRGLDFCPSRNELAIGSSDNTIYLLDKDSLKIKTTIPQAHDNSVFTVKYSPDGNYLLSGGRDAHLKLWDILNPSAPLRSIPAHLYTVNKLTFHPTGKWIATASRDKTIKIWSPEDMSLLKVIDTPKMKGHLNSVNHLFWSPFQDYLISCSDDRTMIVWEIV